MVHYLHVILEKCNLLHCRNAVIYFWFVTHSSQNNIYWNKPLLTCISSMPTLQSVSRIWKSPGYRLNLPLSHHNDYPYYTMGSAWSHFPTWATNSPKKIHINVHKMHFSKCKFWPMFGILRGKFWIFHTPLRFDWQVSTLSNFFLGSRKGTIDDLMDIYFFLKLAVLVFM